MEKNLPGRVQNSKIYSLMLAMDGLLWHTHSCLLHWFEASKHSHELSGNEKKPKTLTLVLCMTLNVINKNTEKLNRRADSSMAKP